MLHVNQSGQLVAIELGECNLVEGVKSYFRGKVIIFSLVDN